MTITITLLALTLIASFGILLLNVLSAPEGYEDENGFHAVAGNSAELVPVVAEVSTQRIAA